jgi:hypothetical protein
LLLCACGDEKAGTAIAATASPVASEAVTPKTGETASPVQLPTPIPKDAAGGNRPPQVVTLEIGPEIVYPGTLIRAEATAEDADGDLVMFEYQWQRNGEVLSDTTMNELGTTGFRKGDRIAVAVMPSDGKVKGKSVNSHQLIIQNRPPEITSLPSAGVNIGQFQYQLQAIDPDGDKLNFTLEQAPGGMIIDADTGLVKWIVPPGLNGKQQVRIVVSDGDAKTFQAFNLNLGDRPL